MDALPDDGDEEDGNQDSQNHHRNLPPFSLEQIDELLTILFPESQPERYDGSIRANRARAEALLQEQFSGLSELHINTIATMMISGIDQASNRQRFGHHLSEVYDPERRLLLYERGDALMALIRSFLLRPSPDLGPHSPTQSELEFLGEMFPDMEGAIAPLPKAQGPSNSVKSAEFISIVESAIEMNSADLIELDGSCSLARGSVSPTMPGNTSQRYPRNKSSERSKETSFVYDLQKSTGVVDHEKHLCLSNEDYNSLDEHLHTKLDESKAKKQNIDNIVKSSRRGQGKREAKSVDLESTEMLERKRFKSFFADLEEKHIDVLARISVSREKEYKLELIRRANDLFHPLRLLPRGHDPEIEAVIAMRESLQKKHKGLEQTMKPRRKKKTYVDDRKTHACKICKRVKVTKNTKLGRRISHSCPDFLENDEDLTGKTIKVKFNYTINGDGNAYSDEVNKYWQFDSYNESSQTPWTDDEDSEKVEVVETEEREETQEQKNDSEGSSNQEENEDHTE